ncbi:MAG: endonuclease/exonuclease/phosphatase family protein [Planctomycetota bacterium]
MPSRWAWLADMCATLAAQALVVGMLAVVVAIVARRLAAAVVSLAAVLVLGVALLDVPRAERSSDPEGPVVTVLAFNAWSTGTRGPDQLEMLLEADADLVMLNEASDSLLSELRTDPRVASAYPHHRLPDRAGPGYRLVLSKHPFTRGEAAFGFVWPEIEAALGRHGMRVVRVELPEGPMVFAGVQFRSPRSAARWAVGNTQAAETAAGLSMIADVTRLPIVVAGDLNASPLGVRSRRFAEASGLVRAKPALRIGGTYPASLPGLARVPIDGALVSPEIRLVSYRVVDAPGSKTIRAASWSELPGQAASSSDSP